MSTYVVTQDGARFEVRRGDASGPVVATFSNKLAAETFAEKQRLKDQDPIQRGPATQAVDRRCHTPVTSRR